jgi:polysaccharide biosynthesis protein PelF
MTDIAHVARERRLKVLGADQPVTDVCIIVEGCYPYIAGGVSSWIDWLIKTQPETTFSIVCLWPRPTRQPPRYVLPPNAHALHHLYLQDFGAPPRNSIRPPRDISVLAEALGRFVTEGGAAQLEVVRAALQQARRRVSIESLFNSPIAWEIVQRMYAGAMPQGSFLHYFWAWRALLGGLLATLEFELPPAKVYHTISTGYAGVLAARAALETGRPMVLTEHGIYTNERRIELLMADWVADTVEKGHALDDPRFDLRDMWVRAFEAYSRTCYETATEVVTLFEDNQRAQRLLGASDDRLRVIANGIDLKRFAGLAQAAADARPTMALIGRVVPIKDVKSFISAARILRERIPDLAAVVLGPTDEDPDYFAECEALVRELDLGGCVTFTGPVNIVEYLPQVHVAVLTSLSESQPLVILEAGAAGIPFVATNVGSCREILEGRSDEQPPLGPGGIVTDLVAPSQIADAVGRLLLDAGLRQRYGETLRQRVSASYTSAQAAGAYTRLYASLIAGARAPAASRKERV